MCLVAQSCPAPANPWTVACLPGSFVHEDSPGIILEWVAMPSSRRSSQLRPRTPTLQADALPSEPPGKRPVFWISFLFRSLQSID